MVALYFLRMNVSSQRSIPPHLRESVFRTYEPLLVHAVRVWPTESVHGCPKDLSFATFSAGVRNAINSVLEFKWDTELDIEKLREMRKSRAFVIAATATNAIHFRAPGREKITYEVKSSTVETPSLIAPPPSVVPARDMTANQIDAFATLLDAGLITGPILIRGPVSEDVAMSLMAQYAVFFTFDPDKNETILT